MGVSEAGLEAEGALGRGCLQRRPAHPDFLVRPLGVEHGEVQVQVQILVALDAAGADDRRLAVFN